MKHVRIAILNTNNMPVAFMDNKHKKSMHYWNDELHEYLQGTANTYSFTVNAKHGDSEHVTIGNKVAFIYKGKSYYLNIINTDQTEETITATAWSLSFELINEDAGRYKAEKAMSFAEYLAVFDAEKTLKLGVNEVSDKRITNEWTGTTSVLKRLFSLANVFSAEIEFKTVLNRDYSLKEIILNVYREHSNTDSGIGEYRNDIVLRYGKGITGIRKTTDAESLYTCIQPTGKDGLTINGLNKKEYDENGNIEYFTDGTIIRAPQARDRFPSNIVNKADAYILMRKEYDTGSREKLYSMALSDLKVASEPIVTYEVDGYFDTAIGDTVRIQDQEWTPVLYLQARVSEQMRSLTDPKVAKTVFSNYKELTSEISDNLLQEMKDLIAKNKVYTCSISTNNGIVFKNGVGSTTLTAHAYDNGVDIADRLKIQWKKDGQELYTGRSVTVNSEAVDTKAIYSFEAFENNVKRGYYEVTVTNVSDGTPGKDGTTYYTWIKYADDEYGNGISDSPDGKQYMGIANNKERMDESLDPADYQWSRITGEGIPGKPGADGKTYYTWVRYADDLYGNGMSDSPNGKYYIGLAFNKESQTESNNPQDYQWSKYRGDNGSDGQDGVGISRITKYYLASNKNTGITASTYGWTTTMQQITPQKRYLWSYESTLYTDQSSTNTTPIIIGVHGEDGDSSGVMESASPPDNPHTGMLWKNTGTSGGRVQGAVYRWNGSMWELFKFTASNIEAETFKGFDFIGANFTSVDEFISPHHIDDNTVVEAKHKVNLKISKGAIVATDDLYFKQGEGWTSSPQEHRLTQLLAGNGIYCYIEDYRTGERKRMSLDADGFEPPLSFFNLVYPVGSIYMSVNPINPSELFPLTAWAEWGKGRVPVGVDTSQTEFNKAEKTGGSKAVTLTVDQIPSHTHKVPKPEWYGVKSEADTGFGMLKTKNPIKDGSDGFVSASAGGGKAHSNLQPYITCYMWVRTA